MTSESSTTFRSQVWQNIDKQFELYQLDRQNFGQLCTGVFQIKKNMFFCDSIVLFLLNKNIRNTTRP